MSGPPPPPQAPVTYSSSSPPATSPMRTSKSSDASTSSRASSNHHQTLNFFQKHFGHRNTDYCSDAPQQAATGSNNIGSTAATAGGGNPNSRGPSTRSFGSRFSSARTMGDTSSAGGGPRTPFWAWCRPRNINHDADRRRLWFKKILESRLWRSLLIVLTFILLFGPTIQFTVIPKEGDKALDAIYMATFCLFWIDILMRMDAEPNYFAFNVPCRKKKERAGGGPAAITEGQAQHHANTDASVGGGGGCCNGCCPFDIGSFLFYCDVFSTLAMLYDISFITPQNFDAETDFIKLDQFGIPMAGLDTINAASPVKPDQEIGLLVIIAKSARAARFIRSSTAVKISSKVNWYWFLNILNPFWWWNFCQRSMQELPDESSETDSSRSMILGRDIRSNKQQQQLSGSHDPSASWGGTGTGPMASGRTDRSSQSLRASQQSGLLSVPKRFLGYLGFIPRDDEEWKRELAAIKIQRAWRAACLRSRAASEDTDDPEDAAWRGRRVSSADPVEQELRKRSFLRKWSKMNRGSVGKSKLTTTNVTTSAGLSRTPLGTSNVPKRRNESQVGTAMRELTGQRVAIGIIIALVITVLFTYTENDATRPSTMIVLHNQTGNEAFADKSLDAARASSVPDLFFYKLADNTTRQYSVDHDPAELRRRDIYQVTVQGYDNATTVGLFDNKDETRSEALVGLVALLFILFVWFFGVTSFAGPVMVLVVIPIERMVRLLGMLMVDPLGYDRTPRYKRFVKEEDTITKNTRWTKEVLKGMETSFLMSTILRIGSLMKVGFGSAGVEIIRHNLEKGQNKKNVWTLRDRGSTVSCIFLFCDIRQFTDATECLQEEVFVFTNRIAGVVHSICHSYEGSANKNVGDAFLLSWKLDEETPTSIASDHVPVSTGREEENFCAKHSQADKALLSVVKIRMALHYDDYYLESMSDAARDALLAKLSKRKGPVVQMGFGLHAGNAVQGAIGSQRKIDATYVSEAVERAEYLESSTKKYGVKVLMSDSFHRLLHPSNRRRCRKVDQILIRDDGDEADDEFDFDLGSGDVIMELFTFDMDIPALWKQISKKGSNESDSDFSMEKGSKRDLLRVSGGMRKGGRRRSLRLNKDGGIDEPVSEQFGSQAELREGEGGGPPGELILPNGHALYNANVWVSEDMRKIRQLYSDGLFFQKFSSGLQSFYARDWEHAKQCFETILERFEDGPSRYFLTQIEENNGVPPKNFRPYGKA